MQVNIFCICQVIDQIKTRKIHFVSWNKRNILTTTMTLSFLLRFETFSNRFCHVAFLASKLRKSESWSRKFHKIRIHLLDKLEKLTSTKAIKASDNSTSGFPLTTFIRSPTPEQSKYLKNYVWKYDILYVIYI